MQPKLNLTPEEFLAIPPNQFRQREAQFRIQISRNTLIAFIASIILHVLMMIVAMPILQQGDEGKVEPSPLQITLGTPKKLAIIPAPVVETIPIPEQKIEKKIEKPKKIITKKPEIKQPNIKTPPVLSVPKELAERTIEPLKTTPVPEVTPPPKEAPVDMMAYVKARRAEKIAQGDAAAINAEAIAKELGPSDDEKRAAKIKQNMKSGTNGIFEVTSLTSRSATFAFRGWTGDYSNAKLQFFEVEAKSGQDIRLQLIRRMIALIREHYQGDFSWESHRLTRVITLSARLEDSAGLEDFLMTEFFGVNYKTQ